MTKDELWDGDINKLPKDYISAVKQIFESQSALGVRFGILGKGIVPNYELLLANGQTDARYGKTGKQFPNTKKFNDGNITRVFSLDELKAAQLPTF
ncbi:hypothetical protein [Pantoea dispersa]|uniref:hypothetical protein n=1 Tax=Pantoea dispersa TaxID=59814 RepID=UPI0021C87BFD|nr:hypothetical protein [Pantoea dispersa]